jgi:hypothetical protein
VSRPAARTRKPTAELAGDDLIAFESFWAEYPRKEAKGHARNAFKIALVKSSAGDLVHGARRYAEKVQAERTEPRFVKHPATWLNAEAWLDQSAPAYSNQFDSTGRQPRNDRPARTSILDVAQELLSEIDR